ncbi:ferulic acid esterase A [Verticillium dahliae]|nr:ferulic acid esterase A [Verticillium dahliae]
MLRFHVGAVAPVCFVVQVRYSQFRSQGKAASVQNVLARTPGCGKKPPSSGTKNIGDRQYILQIPANYNANRAKSTIFVAPNGLNAGWANSGDSDITFVDQILAQVQDALCGRRHAALRHGLQLRRAMSTPLRASTPIFGLVRPCRVSVIAGARRVVPTASTGVIDSLSEGFPVWWIAHGGDHVPEHAVRAPRTGSYGDLDILHSGCRRRKLAAPSPTVPPTTPPAGAYQPPVPAAWWRGTVLRVGPVWWPGMERATCCQSGSTCRAQNQWYSQCL